MKNLILSIIAVSALMFSSCGKGDEPQPQQRTTTTPPAVVVPDYHYNIKYKGVTYDVNGGIDFTDNTVINPTIGGTNNVVNCTEFTQIKLKFVRAYNPTLSSSPTVFNGSNNINLTGFTGVIPQIPDGNANMNTNLPYKGMILISGTSNNTDYLHQSKDVNYDISTYYFNIYEIGLDKSDINGQKHYIKGTFNILLKNNEIITGDFCMVISGITY